MTHSMDEMLAVFQKRMIADLKRGYPDYVMDGEDSLVFAMKDVYAHTKCPFIILIDEWDCLFREYKQDKEAQKKYLDFLRVWMKDQEYVALPLFSGFSSQCSQFLFILFPLPVPAYSFPYQICYFYENLSPSLLILANFYV